jgi:hypothetical protein
VRHAAAAGGPWVNFTCLFSCGGAAFGNARSGSVASCVFFWRRLPKRKDDLVRAGGGFVGAAAIYEVPPRAGGRGGAAAFFGVARPPKVKAEVARAGAADGCVVRLAPVKEGDDFCLELANGFLFLPPNNPRRPRRLGCCCCNDGASTGAPRPDFLTRPTEGSVAGSRIA